GTFVARIPVHELEEAMLVRTALELALLQRVARAITPQTLARLDALLEEQRRPAQADDRGGFHRADEAFHATLAALAGRPGVWGRGAQAKTKGGGVRRLALPLQGRMQEVIEEHVAVVEGLRTGSPTEATAAMRRHLNHVLPAMAMTQ